MTDRVVEQLEAYGARANLVAPAVIMDDIVLRPPAPVRTERTSSGRLTGWAIAVAAAVIVLIVIGGASLLLGGSDASIGVPPAARSTPDVSTTVPESPATVPETPIAAEGWDPILSETIAAAAPDSATCLPEADPDSIGPADQPRPWGAAWGNQAGVFDRHAGKVLFVGERGDLWTFDVCANTWQQQDVSPAPGASMLVYDVDSDVTIGFGSSSVWVYDANTATATRRLKPAEYEVQPPGLGAVYDPVSGLAIVQTSTSGLVAYDVDTDSWTRLGTVGIEDAHPLYLIGYAQETDQLVLVESSQESSRGLLVGARTGDAVAFAGPEGGLFAGFGRLHYATSTSSPLVVDDRRVCRLDPTALEWDCLELALGPGAFTDAGSGSGLLGAAVGDPINNRTLLIYGYGPGFDGARFYDVNDIWAIDDATGEWTHLLEATGPMTWENDN